MSDASAESTPGHAPSAGDAGPLSERPLPRLLLDLHRHRFDGALELTRGKTSKRIVFQQGAPVLSESNLASETLGLQLVDQGIIERLDHDRVSAYMARKQCKEGVALLALELLKPKGLFIALKEQVRRRLLEAFAWSDGSYAVSAVDDLESQVQPLRSDTLALVREGLLNHWTPDRLLSDLTAHIDRYPVRTPSFEDAQRRLGRSEELLPLFQGLDGTRTFGTAIGSGFNSLSVLATCWILASGGFLRFEDVPIAADEDEVSFDAEVEIEVVSSSTAAAKPKAASSGSSSAGQKPLSDAATAMRKEVLECLEGLQTRSLYELLGVAENASHAEIRKAYFKAAKRFHPDALNHLGLSDIKEEAAQVFARIAEANDVLRDSAKRADYDARMGSDEPAVDTHALARAETFYRKGEIMIRMGDFRGALEYLENAVQLWPDECEYQSMLGWALYRQPKAELDRAIAHLQKAVELDAKDAVAHFRLGTVQRANGNENLAAESLARARSLDPNVS